MLRAKRLIGPQCSSVGVLGAWWCFPTSFTSRTAAKLILAAKVRVRAVCLKDDGTGDGTLHAMLQLSGLYYFQPFPAVTTYG